MKLLKGKITGIFFIIFLIICWEIYSISSNAPVYFPPFSQILYTFFGIIVSLEFVFDVAQTLWRCLLGFIIATFFAIPIGILLGRLSFFFNLLNIVIEFFRPMPSAAIIPISILFLGIDNKMKIFVIFFGSLWPILINTIDGVRGIEPIFLKTTHVFGLSKTKLYTKVIFPAALPSIFTGLRVSIAISLILTITVEMIVGGNGVGYFILDAERSFKFKEMYAGVIVIGIIGYSINLFATYIEKKIIFWHYRQ
jgi:sulfonate transport system permease protein